MPTLAFLFTDIEASTRLWERHPEAMARDLARSDELNLPFPRTLLVGREEELAAIRGRPGASEALRERIGAPLPPAETEQRERTRAAARQNLDPAVFAAA